MSDEVEFDPAKDAANRLKHGLGLGRWPSFDVEPMIIADVRFAYAEQRFLAVGRIGGQPHVATFTKRGQRIRMIGFRKAHEKEMRRYGL